MMKYFENVKTLDELKKQYRRLAMKYHPDMGGSTEAMQQINAEHDALFEMLKKQHNASADEYHQTTETAAEFRDIIDFLMKFDDLEVELVGSWVWCGGNTKPHKDDLKAAGFTGPRTRKDGIGITPKRAASGDVARPQWTRSAGSMEARFSAAGVKIAHLRKSGRPAEPPRKWG